MSISRSLQGSGCLVVHVALLSETIYSSCRFCLPLFLEEKGLEIFVDTFSATSTILTFFFFLFLRQGFSV